MIESGEIIIKLLRGGNWEVFESVYEKYYGRLFIYCKEYVLDDEIAKELVQDTFLKLWENKSTLRNDTYIQAYLYRLAKNLCLNFIKHLKVQNKYLRYSKTQLLELSMNMYALRDKSSELAISNELESIINTTIDELPPQCKRIFELSRMEGKKHKEIASELCISINTVENQIQKALKIFKKNLAEFIISLSMLFIDFFKIL